MTFKAGMQIAKETVSEFNDDNALTLGAALAYYAMFSIGPLLAIIVALAGAAFGFDVVRDYIHSALQEMFGEGTAKAVASMITTQQKGSVLMKVVAVATLIFGATGVFAELQGSLNFIWGVKSKPGLGFWLFVRNRLLSFGMLLTLGFVLMVSLALSTALEAFAGVAGQAVSHDKMIVEIFDVMFSYCIITVLLAMIFKFLPDVKVPWNKVWVGAIGTSLLFTLGKHFLGLYLGKQSTASAYGAAGSIIVLLMWVYYTSLIVFLGAEFTQVYAYRANSDLEPTEYAVRIKYEIKEAPAGKTELPPA